MGVSFGAQVVPASGKAADWKFGELGVHTTATNAFYILALLGYPDAMEMAECGEEKPAELLRRIEIADHPQHIAIVTERWGDWLPAEGYFNVRLSELTEVAREAQAMGGIVVWS